MRRELPANESGAHSLPLIILFGVVIALLVAILFISVYDQQLSGRVDDEAESLADGLAQAAFASLSGGQPTVDLPRDVGGSVYSIAVQENSVFVVSVTGGRRAGISYSAVVNATITVENGDFIPGGRAYFMRAEDAVIVSAAPIGITVENIAAAPSTQPPAFYEFSKQSPHEAAAITAAYFEAKSQNPGENVDVLAYSWEGADSLLVQVRIGSGEEITRIVGSDNDTAVGAITTAWVIDEIGSAGAIPRTTSCPSPDEAYVNGWLHSPQAALSHLRSRTWKRVNDNAIVAVPSDAAIQAAAVTTNVSIYPAWRVEFEDYTIFYQMLPWWELENSAGFVFQSSPELKPAV